MPTLIVLRHAKAVHALGLADIERPLTERGRRDSAGTGDWLRDAGLVPDRVVCSPAQRTRETLEHLGLGAGEGPEVAFESGVYDNDVDTLLSLLRESPARARSVLLIGHNPSMHELVQDLTGDAPERFPTCALAVIELAGGWADIGTGVLTAFRTPKD